MHDTSYEYLKHRFACILEDQRHLLIYIFCQSKNDPPKKMSEKSNFKLAYIRQFLSYEARTTLIRCRILCRFQKCPNM